MEYIHVTPDTRALMILVVIVTAIPILSLLFAFKQSVQSSPYVWAGGCLAVLFLCAYAVTFVRGTISYSESQLKLNALIVSVNLEAQDVLWQESYAAEADDGLSIRTMGVGFPGFGAGWFKLKNGKKAFVIVTGDDKVGFPTCEEYDLVVDKEVALELQAKFLSQSASCG